MPSAKSCMQKHRVLPLMKRGKRLFLAVADPTNLHALDEIRFQTSMGIEFVVVEDDKLQIGGRPRPSIRPKPSCRTSRDEDFDLENLEVTGGDDEANAETLGPRRRRGRAHRPLRQQDPARRDQEGRLGHPLRALREDLPHPHPHRRGAQGGGPAAGAARGQDRRAPQGHGPPRHRRAPRAAGRPHQDAAVQEPRHRLSRQHLPHAVRREGGHAYPRSVERHARHRCAGLRAGAARDCTCATSASRRA